VHRRSLSIKIRTTSLRLPSERRKNEMSGLRTGKSRKLTKAKNKAARIPRNRLGIMRDAVTVKAFLIDPRMKDL
jgi:hypothetical protein